MKTKIGMSLGLALTLMVGVFATMLALGLFTTTEVGAQQVEQSNGSATRSLPCDGGPRRNGDGDHCTCGHRAARRGHGDPARRVRLREQQLGRQPGHRLKWPGCQVYPAG